MMFDSVLVKVSCSEELLYLHTISRRHKSPYRFAILRDTLEQLEREPGRQIIVADCGCYAALRLTRALDGEMLVIRFSWLQSAGADSLRGYEEWVRLPYRRFHECVEAGTDMAGWNWSQLSVPEKVTRRFEFHSRQNLHRRAGTGLQAQHGSGGGNQLKRGGIEQDEQDAVVASTGRVKRILLQLTNCLDTSRSSGSA